MAPFESVKTNEAYLLQPDFNFNPSTALKEVEKLSSVKRVEEIRQLDNKIWSKETYLEKARTVINDLKQNKLQKLVLSRVIEKKLATTDLPLNLMTLGGKGDVESWVVNFSSHQPVKLWST